MENNWTSAHLERTRRSGLTWEIWKWIITRRLKTRRTVWNWRSLGTCDLSIKTPNNMEDSQRVPCHLIATLYWKQNIWKQLPQTTTWITGRRRSIRGRNYLPTPMKRKRISILCEMERISNHQSDMGIWISLLRWWKHAPNLQRSISTLTQKDLFLLDDKD